MCNSRINDISTTSTVSVGSPVATIEKNEAGSFGYPIDSDSESEADDDFNSAGEENDSEMEDVGTDCDSGSEAGVTDGPPSLPATYSTSNQEKCPPPNDAQSKRDAFIGFVFSMAQPKELGELTVDFGLSEAAQKAKHAELQACADNENDMGLSWMLQLFCNQNYKHEIGLRYDVMPEKALLFFKKVMFGRKTRSYFYKNQYKNVKTNVILPGVHSTVLQYVAEDEKGRMVIWVPCGENNMDQALRALNFLQRRQHDRLVNPSRAVLLKHSTALKDTIARHCKGLIVSVQYNEKGQKLTDNPRNYYNISEHIAAPNLELANRRQFFWDQENLCLAIRHAMMLRDENLRALNLADCYADILRKPSGGTQSVVSLSIAIHGRTTNQRQNSVQRGLTIRHHDVRRCAVGAFAWASAWLMLPILDAHSGSFEVRSMKVAQEQIKKADRWVSGNGKSVQFYQRNYPVEFAFCTAGFKDTVFYLLRNEVAPPKELQRKLFDFI
ncbi:hypothetical protein BG004_007866 [Podila humilis]|nr:hypothetical protein BG004_007866 [Podila humilis]